jgi:hypothetical protein
MIVKERFLENLEEESNFGIIVKNLINLGVTMIIWGETRKSQIKFIHNLLKKSNAILYQ